MDEASNVDVELPPLKEFDTQLNRIGLEAQAGTDPESRDIADQFNFQMNTLQKNLEVNKNDYFANKADDSEPVGFDSKFIQAKPQGDFLSV